MAVSTGFVPWNSGTLPAVVGAVCTVGAVGNEIAVPGGVAEALACADGGAATAIGVGDALLLASVAAPWLALAFFPMIREAAKPPAPAIKRPIAAAATSAPRPFDSGGATLTTLALAEREWDPVAPDPVSLERMAR